MRVRLDGLVNCFTGLGDPALDTRQNTRRTSSHQRSTWALEQEWGQSWMAFREVSQLPWDMFREGFNLVKVEPPDTDVAEIMSAVEGNLDVKADGQLDRQRGLLYYAWQLREQGDKVGGAVLLPILDDGKDPSQPLDVRSITRVLGWQILDRSEISPWHGSHGLNTEPEYYVLSDVLTAVGRRLQPGDVIHRSRLWINPGRLLSMREMRLRQWWGASILELGERERRGAEEGTEYARTYMDRQSWLHLQLAGLNELFQAKDDEGNPIGEALVEQRARAVREFTRTMGIAVTDGGLPSATTRDGEVIVGRNPDKLESVAESPGEMSSLVQMNLDQWQYGAGMPRSIAFGEAAGGLNGGKNEGDWQSWQGVVRAQQSLWATPLINWMLTIVMSARMGPTHGVRPAAWEVKWKPLLVPSPLEVARADLERARADEVRINSSVAKVDDVRQQRMIQGDTDGPLRATEEEKAETAITPISVGVATAIMNAGTLIGAGELPAGFLAAVLPTWDPRYTPEIAAAIAASAKPAEAEALQGAVAAPVDVVDAEPIAPDEAEIAFSNDPRPSDLMSSTSIVEALAKINVEVTPHKITKMAKAGTIKTWLNFGKRAHSLAEVRRLSAIENGMVSAPVADEPTGGEPE